MRGFLISVTILAGRFPKRPKCEFLSIALRDLLVSFRAPTDLSCRRNDHSLSIVMTLNSSVVAFRSLSTNAFSHVVNPSALHSKPEADRFNIGACMRTSRSTHDNRHMPYRLWGHRFPASQNISFRDLLLTLFETCFSLFFLYLQSPGVVLHIQNTKDY